MLIEDGGKDQVLEPRGLHDLDARAADHPRHSVLFERKVPERPFLAVEPLEPRRGRYRLEVVIPRTPDLRRLLLRVVEGRGVVEFGSGALVTVEGRDIARGGRERRGNERQTMRRPLDPRVNPQINRRRT